ncbi:MAG: four helix bundle protein [Ideonella sp.]|nr:four helix bundle protein [Ideonella sp.]
MPQDHAPLANDMVIHTKARDLLAWLLPHVAQWPKEHRFGVGQHVGAVAMRVQDALVAARHLRAALKAEALLEADIALDQLRQYLHLAWQCRWMSEGQYLHACGLTDEIGRLLGGWRQRSA